MKELGVIMFYVAVENFINVAVSKHEQPSCLNLLVLVGLKLYLAS